MSMAILSIATELEQNNPEYYQGEINDLPSETIPGQSMSAKEAVLRSDRGLPVSGYCEHKDLPFDGEQRHDVQGNYIGEDIDLDAMNLPVFSDEMDVIDFERSQRVAAYKRWKAWQEKHPTPSKQEPAPQSSEPAPSPDPAPEPPAKS